MRLTNHRLVLAAGALAVAGGAIAAPALASKPDIQHFTMQSDYTLTQDITGCTFDVTVSGVDKVVWQTFSDGKSMFHDDFTGTESANGVTLNSSEHAVVTDYPDGSESWTGQPLKISKQHGGTITMDVGKLVYDSDGNIVVEHGPHPYTDGAPDYCNAFTP